MKFCEKNHLRRINSSRGMLPESFRNKPENQPQNATFAQKCGCFSSNFAHRQSVNYSLKMTVNYRIKTTLIGLSKFNNSRYVTDLKFVE